MAEKQRISLTHLTRDGHAHMVNVGEKAVTSRMAVARARVRMSPDTFVRLVSGDTPKGDVLAAARIAAIQAAKLTPHLVPLCHIVQLTKVDVTIELDGGIAVIDVIAEGKDRTGVEMEAMVAASTAALTMYDMLKAIDRGMSFDVCLVQKAGGKSGHWQRPEEESEGEGQGGGASHP
jgi:cyclic pyranopterin phosphate synthase